MADQLKVLVVEQFVRKFQPRDFAIEFFGDRGVGRQAQLASGRVMNDWPTEPLQRRLCLGVPPKAVGERHEGQVRKLLEGGKVRDLGSSEVQRLQGGEARQGVTSDTQVTSGSGEFTPFGMTANRAATENLRQALDFLKGNAQRLVGQSKVGESDI